MRVSRLPQLGEKPLVIGFWVSSLQTRKKKRREKKKIRLEGITHLEVGEVLLFVKKTDKFIQLFNRRLDEVDVDSFARFQDFLNVVAEEVHHVLTYLETVAASFRAAISHIERNFEVVVDVLRVVEALLGLDELSDARSQVKSLLKPELFQEITHHRCSRVTFGLDQANFMLRLTRFLE